MRALFSKNYFWAKPSRTYIFLVVSPIAPVAGAAVASAGAVLVADESLLIVLVLDSVVAGVVVVSVVAVFDSHEVRPTARNKAAADTFRRLVILR